MPEPEQSRRRSEEDAGDTASASFVALWLHADLVTESNLWSGFGDAAGLAEAALGALARHAEFSGEHASQACIALSDDASVQALNARYRGKDKPTNVLSFPAGDGVMPETAGGRRLGDIVIAYETVAAEASAQGIPLAHHFQHLVVHGLLHLLGFDHETPEDADDMESLEIEILEILGIENPYSQDLIQDVS